VSDFAWNRPASRVSLGTVGRRVGNRTGTNSFALERC